MISDSVRDTITRLAHHDEQTTLAAFEIIEKCQKFEQEDEYLCGITDDVLKAWLEGPILYSSTFMVSVEILKDLVEKGKSSFEQPYLGVTQAQKGELSYDVHGESLFSRIMFLFSDFADELHVLENMFGYESAFHKAILRGMFKRACAVDVCEAVRNTGTTYLSYADLDLHFKGLFNLAYEKVSFLKALEAAIENEPRIVKMTVKILEHFFGEQKDLSCFPTL
jgi:hypothetical protein